MFVTRLFVETAVSVFKDFHHIFLTALDQIPSAPVSEEDYSLGRSRASPRSSEKYQALMDLLRKQHEVKTFSFKSLLYKYSFTSPFKMFAPAS